MSQKDYLAGLKDYWSGRPRTAIEHISKTIADSPSNDSHLPLYRLWVELLASENDHAALRSLADHLRQRAENEQEYVNTYFALRGLIDFELEQIQSAELKLAALKSVQNMYVWELRCRMAHRCGMRIDSYNSEKAKEAVAFDYIFAKSYMMNLYHERKFNEATEVAKIIDQTFRGNPLGTEIRMHKNIDQNDFSHALRYAHDLFDQFPGHADYPVFLAFLQIKNGHYPEADMTLSKCESMFGSDDVDVTCLKASLYYLIYMASGDKKDKERSIVQIKNAVATLEKNGYSTANYSKMYHEVIGTMGHIERASSWMVHLNQTEFADLMFKDEHEIKSIKRAIGQETEVGDLVFMVARDAVYKKEGSTNVRLGAVYQVVSEAAWHPIDGHQVVLELVSKPAISIRLPVVFDDLEGKNATNASVVFQMDAIAFEQVYNTIEEYAHDESTVYTLKTELERIRQVS